MLSALDTRAKRLLGIGSRDQTTAVESILSPILIRFNRTSFSQLFYAYGPTIETALANGRFVENLEVGGRYAKQHFVDTSSTFTVSEMTSRINKNHCIFIHMPTIIADIKLHPRGNARTRVREIYVQIISRLKSQAANCRLIGLRRRDWQWLRECKLLTNWREVRMRKCETLDHGTLWDILNGGTKPLTPEMLVHAQSHLPSNLAKLRLNLKKKISCVERIEHTLCNSNQQSTKSHYNDVATFSR